MEGCVPLSQPSLGLRLDKAKFDQSPFDEKLEKLVAEAMEVCRIPGLALAVVDGEATWEKVDQPLMSPLLIDTNDFCKGYGFADARSKKAVEPMTLFAAGRVRHLQNERSTKIPNII